MRRVLFSALLLATLPGCQSFLHRGFHDYKNHNPQCHNHVYLGTVESARNLLKFKDAGHILYWAYVIDFPLTIAVDTLMFPLDLAFPKGQCSNDDTTEDQSRAPSSGQHAR